jgi:hypothetical protein
MNILQVTDIFCILNLRSRFEELCTDLNTDIDSSISGLETFINSSHKCNRFKPNWEEAMNIAKKIVESVK